jgi:acyl-CoA synthetase (AMP-forming)/AMP-acid ligase II
MTMSEQYVRLPLLNSYLEHWAESTPDKPAMLQHEDGRTVTYKQTLSLVDFFALRLLDMGIGPGDRVATMLVLVPEHMILMYACFKIGAIIAPLDARLQEEEVVRDLGKIEPKAFFFLGDTPVRDFREVGRAVRERCPYVEHLVQFTPNPEPGDILEGAVSITDMMDKKRLVYLKLKDLLAGRLKKVYASIEPRTPALIIYTTGTTGEPKPAVLCHENIIVQNEILARGVCMGSEASLLVNLPPSHVGCVTEGFMTTIFVGATAVLLRVFDVGLTLEAIEKRRVQTVGMIPTQYRMLWAHPDFDRTDLSSLDFVVYGGSSVDIRFLERLAQMAPGFGTGIGMTESAGFVTFTPHGISIEEMAGQVGHAFPDLAPVTVRAPRNEDGTAGEELADSEIGEICYHGPIVFLGYFNQPEATAGMISADGVLYTGDLGYFKDMGTYRALYLTGREKFVIKQKGYNVFPGEVEDHIARLEGVDMVEVVGMEHRLFDEGIVAFVRRKAGSELTASQVMEHCEKIAAYKRPQHVEVWPADQQFPLTRVAKVDKLALQRAADPIIEQLRAEGKWDAGA